MRVRVDDPQPDHRHLICEALLRAFDDLDLLQTGPGAPVDLEITAIDWSRSAVRRTDTGEVVFLEKEKGGRFFDELIAAVRRFRPISARRGGPNLSATPPESPPPTPERSVALAWLGRRMASSTRELLELTRWQRAIVGDADSRVLIDQQLRAIERLQRHAADLQLLADAKPDFSATLQPLLSWIQLRASIWRRLATPSLTVEAHPDHHAIYVRADRQGLFELFDSLVQTAASFQAAPEPLRIAVERVWDHQTARVRVEFHGAGSSSLSPQARTRAAILTEALGGTLFEAEPFAIEFEIAEELGPHHQIDSDRRGSACILLLGEPGPVSEALEAGLQRHGIACQTLTKFESAVSLTQAGCRYPLYLIDAAVLNNSHLQVVTRWSVEGLCVVAYSSRQSAHQLNRAQVEQWSRAGLLGLIDEPFPIEALSCLARLDSVRSRESPLSR